MPQNMCTPSTPVADGIAMYVHFGHAKHNVPQATVKMSVSVGKGHIKSGAQRRAHRCVHFGLCRGPKQ